MLFTFQFLAIEARRYWFESRQRRMLQDRYNYIRKISYYLSFGSSPMVLMTLRSLNLKL